MRMQQGMYSRSGKDRAGRKTITAALLCLTLVSVTNAESYNNLTLVYYKDGHVEKIENSTPKQAMKFCRDCEVRKVEFYRGNKALLICPCICGKNK